MRRHHAQVSCVTRWSLLTPIPAAFASTMSNTMYLLRHRELEPLLNVIRKVQQRPESAMRQSR